MSTNGLVKRYAIAGREMEFHSEGDFVVRISFWKAEVAREHAAKKVRNGLPDPRRIYVRLGGNA